MKRYQHTSIAIEIHGREESRPGQYVMGLINSISAMPTKPIENCIFNSLLLSISWSTCTFYDHTVSHRCTKHDPQLLASKLSIIFQAPKPQRIFENHRVRTDILAPRIEEIIFGGSPLNFSIPQHSLIRQDQPYPTNR